MIYSNKSLVKVDEIIADAQLQLGDDSGIIFNQGWYIATVQRGLSKLSFDSKFFLISEEIDFPSDTLSVPVPANCWNLKEVYVYDKGEDCTISNMHEVYWKRHYEPNGYDKGYTARMKPISQKTNVETDTLGADYGSDVYNPEPVSSESNIYYYNIQNGNIVFSSTCKGFDKIKLKFNGTFTPLGETPTVPEMFVEAITQYVVERGFNILKSRDSRAYRALWSDAYNQLYSRNGAWDRATKLAKQLDDKTRRDFLQYNNRLNY